MAKGGFRGVGHHLPPLHHHQPVTLATTKLPKRNRGASRSRSGTGGTAAQAAAVAEAEVAEAEVVAAAEAAAEAKVVGRIEGAVGVVGAV